MRKKITFLTLTLLLMLVLVGCEEKPAEVDNSKKTDTVANDIKNENKPSEKPADNSPTAPDAQKGVQLTFKELKTEDEFVIIDAQIPVVSGLQNPEKEKELNDNWEQRVREHSENIRQDGKLEYQNQQTAPGSAVPSFRKFGYNLRCETKHLGKFVLSFVQNFDTYMGGAHGSPYREGVTLDLATGKIMTLADWFKPGKDYTAYINAAIKKEIAKSKELYFDDGAAFKGITADHQYYVEADNLVIVIQYEEIAAYAAGILEFKIPIAELVDYGFKAELLGK